MKVRRISLILLCLAVAAIGAWWWQHASNSHEIVAAALPATPDLTASAVLTERVASAESRARSLITAPKGLAELSRLYHANGFLEEATRCYTGLEKLNPSEARWMHLHASILAGYGETEAAIQLWRQVVKLAPEYIPARLRLGDCLLKTNQSAEAAAIYSDVLKRNPDNAYALLGLARIDFEAGHWVQARERLEVVVKQTNYNLGYDLIVSLYEKLGQHERALSIRGMAKASGAYRDAPDPWQDELIDVCFDPYRLALAAGVSVRFGEPAKSIALLERAIALAPADVSSHFQLGCIQVDQNNFPAAREQFQLCIQLAPEFADGWAHLSSLQEQTGDSAAAKQTLLTGLARCPGSPGLHLMRARNLQHAGLINEAISEYRISIRLRPNEPEAYVEMGNMLITAGREAEGITQMRLALDADPGDPTALGVLTFYSISIGNEAEARRWFARVSMQPRMPSEQIARLHEIFRQAFGHDWAPATAE